MSRLLVLLLPCALFIGSFAARQPVHGFLVDAPQDRAAAYVGVDTCKDCHADIFKAWSRTKHAQALGKLQAADRTGGKCIGCHVTGSPDTILAEDAQPSLPNVQCEACHGPGGLHVDAARAGTVPVVRTAAIVERSCTRCHNETSPHYKPFFYSAMVGLVHR